MLEQLKVDAFNKRENAERDGGVGVEEGEGRGW